MPDDHEMEPYWRFVREMFADILGRPISDDEFKRFRTGDLAFQSAAFEADDARAE